MCVYVRDRQVKAVVDDLQVKVSQVKTKAGKRSGDNATNSPVSKKVKKDLQCPSEDTKEKVQFPDSLFNPLHLWHGTVWATMCMSIRLKTYVMFGPE